MSFSNLGLSRHITEGVKAMGYSEPTPIQLRAIPLILSSKDVIGSAQTGTGKTAAFALPILSHLGDSAPNGPRVLVLEPTRELAAQVETSFRDLARFTNLKIGVVFGGVGYGKQNETLRQGLDILIATPGRLLDYMSKGTIRLGGVKHLVLDEADRMLDMGFLPDVRRIVEKCPRERQTCLFSATIPPDIDALIKWSMRNPEVIDIGSRRSPAETVKHVLYPVADDQKADLLRALLAKGDCETVIVFCRTKHRADRVAVLLKKNNHAVAVLHSNRTQSQREQALLGFRKGRYNILVATDIAARGIDVPEVSHVINYDVPNQPEDYIHRIGRTGRAMATGDAYTLVTNGDAAHVAAIERFLGRKIEHARLADFTYRAQPRVEERKDRPARQKRSGWVRSPGGAQPVSGRRGNQHRRNFRKGGQGPQKSGNSGSGA